MHSFPKKSSPSPGPLQGWLDGIIGILLLASLAFAPWAFGSTQTWAVVALNISGTSLGILWLFQNFWFPKPAKSWSWTTQALFWTTLSILGYSLLMALNAQSTFDPATAAFHPLPHLSWLPHSYDRHASWFVCWQNFALAGTFWATRDWLLAGARNSHSNGSSRDTGSLPHRSWHLIYFIVTNGFLLAVVGLLQRWQNTPKLLWLVQPQINYEAWMQFGPYAYRSNGLQYLELVWPLGLAAWSLLVNARSNPPAAGLNLGRWGLLVFALTMMICPFFWESRLSLAVNLLAILFATVILLKASRGIKLKSILAGVVLLPILAGLTLNWHGWSERFARAGFHSAERWKLYRAGFEMLHDHWASGSGPGSFIALYQLYRPDSDSLWQVYLHCDWLQTLVTYGLGGFLLVLGAGVLVVISPWNRHSLVVPDCFVSLVALSLGTGLLNATLDFPFQIYSIQHLFVVLAAFYTTMSLESCRRLNPF